MYVVQHGEASVHAMRSTGTKIAIIRAPSGKAVRLINIKEEGESQIHRFITGSIWRQTENVRKSGRKRRKLVPFKRP